MKEYQKKFIEFALEKQVLKFGKLIRLPHCRSSRFLPSKCSVSPIGSAVQEGSPAFLIKSGRQFSATQ